MRSFELLRLFNLLCEIKKVYMYAKCTIEEDATTKESRHKVDLLSINLFSSFFLPVLTSFTH